MSDRHVLVRRYVDELLNGPDPMTAARDLLTSGFTFLGPGNRDGIHGSDAFAGVQEVMRGALDELRFEMLDAIVADDGAALVLRMTGTHRAAFAGVEPHGAKVSLELVDVLRFDGDRIAAVTAYLDAADLRRQLEAGSV